MVVPAIVAQDGRSGVPGARSVWLRQAVGCSLGGHATGLVVLVLRLLDPVLFRPDPCGEAATPGGSNFSGCGAPAMASRCGAGQRRPMR